MVFIIRKVWFFGQGEWAARFWAFLTFRSIREREEGKGGAAWKGSYASWKSISLGGLIALFFALMARIDYVVNLIL